MPASRDAGRKWPSWATKTERLLAGCGTSGVNAELLGLIQRFPRQWINKI